ncbi:MAG: sortase [Clostridia bacterium]|nr:sortase [Clostridia bacterium]
MFNSKYSKVLTAILIIAIIGIVGVLIFLGIDYYRKYMITTDTAGGISEFDGYVNNIIANENTNTNTNTDTNTNTQEQPNIEENVVPNIDANTLAPDTNTQTGGNTSSGSSSSSSKPTYKGFEMVGKIEIPKTNVKLPVLAKATPKSIEASVGVLYGDGINQVGNTVIVGHNFRNGTFFSNNKKLAEGDKIYLTDLQGRRVTYTIYKKYNTSPEDFNYATRDTNGKREISLSTCTDDTKSRLIIWAKED